MHILPLSRAEIVYDDDVMAFGYICIHDIGADEPGPSRDKDPHETPVPIDSPREIESETTFPLLSFGLLPQGFLLSRGKSGKIALLRTGFALHLGKTLSETIAGTP